MSEESPTDGLSVGKPAKKPRKPRAPRKKKTPDPAAATEPPATEFAQAVGQVVATAQAQQQAPAAPPQPHPDDAAEREAIQAEPARQVAVERVSGNGHEVELKGARPRKSGRRPWDINLGGDGHTWERVTTPENEQVFRFKDEPTPRQMGLIQEYNFNWDPDLKEASRHNDKAGHAAADSLAFFLKRQEREQKAAVGL